MPELMFTFTAAAPWLGLSLLALILLANAYGVLDQSVAVRELAAEGVPTAPARAMVAAERTLQFVAVPVLFVELLRPFAAILLRLFLIGASLAAHAFWSTPTSLPGEHDRQLANFLKNIAIVGGLLLADGWRT